MQKHPRFHFIKSFSCLSEATAVKAVAAFLQSELQKQQRALCDADGMKKKNISASGITHRDELSMGSNWR